MSDFKLGYSMEDEPFAAIKVIGVGGGGNNAVNYFAENTVIGRTTGYDTRVEQPRRIISLPHLEQFIASEDVDERYTQLGHVLQVLRHIVERFYEFSSVECRSHFCRVGEQFRHQSTGIVGLFKHLARLFPHRVALDSGLRFETQVLDHIFHVVFAGIHRYVERRIKPLKLSAEIEHAKHAPP